MNNEPMNREQMIEKLTAYCQARPITSCNTCAIRRVNPGGIGCIKIKNRTDTMLAADVLLLPQEQPAEVKSIVMQAPEQPSIKHMVTVDRDVLQRIRGSLEMISCCVGAEINREMSNLMLDMAIKIREEIDACDLEAHEAEKAMHEALQREREALEQKEKE